VERHIPGQQRRTSRASPQGEAHRNLIVSGCGELAHTLTTRGLADEFWFWVNPHLWAEGPRIFDGVGPVRLQFFSSTQYRSGVLWLCYRPAVS
jgi:dihydrofolate reductase